jgi:hypothetical protein
MSKSILKYMIESDPTQEEDDDDNPPPPPPKPAPEKKNNWLVSAVASAFGKTVKDVKQSDSRLKQLEDAGK